MATTTLVPVEEYLKHINKRPAYEYIDGVLIEKPMGSFLHGILQGWLATLLNTRYPKYGTATELHSRLREKEYRLPDLAIQHRNIALSEAYGITPLILTIEILSPNDDLDETLAKCERYHKWGVPYCWVIDPEKRLAWSYRNGGSPLPAEQTLEAGDIAFTLKEVFSGLDPNRGQEIPQ